MLDFHGIMPFVISKTNSYWKLTLAYKSVSVLMELIYTLLLITHVNLFDQLSYDIALKKHTNSFVMWVIKFEQFKITLHFYFCSCKFVTKCELLSKSAMNLNCSLQSANRTFHREMSLSCQSCWEKSNNRMSFIRVNLDCWF